MNYKRQSINYKSNHLLEWTTGGTCWNLFPGLGNISRLCESLKCCNLIYVVKINKQIHSRHNYFICENTKHLHVLSINFLLLAKLNRGLISDGKHEQLIEANQSIIFKKRKIFYFFLSNKQATTKLQINILKRWKKQEYFLLRSKQHWFKITFNFCVCGKIQIISNIYQTCCISLYYRRLLTFYNQMQAKQNLLPCIPFLPAGHYSSFAL